VTRGQLEHVIRAAATIADDNDLVISKYAAGREKDMEFVRTVIANGMVDEETLRAHLAGTAVDEETRERIAAFIGRDFSGRP
jgi:hypothetical protein